MRNKIQLNIPLKRDSSSNMASLIPGGLAVVAIALPDHHSALGDKDHSHSKRNEVKEIRNYKQLEKIDLDYESPRLKLAMYNLGVSKEECMKK